MVKNEALKTIFYNGFLLILNVTVKRQFKMFWIQAKFVYWTLTCRYETYQIIIKNYKGIMIQSINQSINFIYPRIYSVALKC